MSLEDELQRVQGETNHSPEIIVEENIKWDMGHKIPTKRRKIKCSDCGLKSYESYDFREHKCRDV